MESAFRARKLVAQVAGATLVAGGLTAVVALPAMADDFTPGNTAPTVTTVGGGSGPYSLTPLSPAQVQVTVGDADTLQDLNTVTLCLYRTSGGDSTCSSIDTTNTIKIVWSRSTNTFALSAGSPTSWALNSPTGNYVATNVSMTLDFNFIPGKVARTGAWSVKSIAADATTSTTDTDGDNFSMGYYGSVLANRSSYSYSTVASGGSSTNVNKSDGTFTSNDASDVTIRQTAFTMSSPTSKTAGIAGGAPTDAPSAGEVALDCNNTATFPDATGAIRLMTGAQTLEANVLTSGTGETGSSALVNSCRLSSGGRLPVGSYSATITMGIGAH